MTARFKHYRIAR